MAFQRQRSDSFDFLDGIAMVVSKLSWRRFRAWLRRRRDVYDPRKTEYVTQATAEEVEILRIAELHRQISKLEAALLKRPSQDSKVTQHYVAIIGEMRAEAAAAELRAAEAAQPVPPPDEDLEFLEDFMEVPMRARFDSDVWNDELEEVAVPRRARFDSEPFDIVLEEAEATPGESPDKLEAAPIMEPLKEQVGEHPIKLVGRDFPHLAEQRLPLRKAMACRPRRPRRPPMPAPPKC